MLFKDQERISTIPYKVLCLALGPGVEWSWGVLRFCKRSVNLMEVDERGQEGCRLSSSHQAFIPVIVGLRDWIIVLLGYSSDLCLSLPASTKQAVPEDQSPLRPGRPRSEISPTNLHICPFPPRLPCQRGDTSCFSPLSCLSTRHHYNKHLFWLRIPIICTKYLQLKTNFDPIETYARGLILVVSWKDRMNFVTLNSLKALDQRDHRA